MTKLARLYHHVGGASIGGKPSAGNRRPRMTEPDRLPMPGQGSAIAGVLPEDLPPAQVALKGFGEDHEVYAVPPERIAKCNDGRL